MKAILQYLWARGFGCASDAAYDRIEVWQAWYRGKVPAFHTYRQYNGKRKLTRQRRSLGMAKAVAEDWANLALNEKVEICIKGKQLEKRVREVLENNNFRVRAISCSKRRLPSEPALLSSGWTAMMCASTMCGRA